MGWDGFRSVFLFPPPLHVSEAAYKLQRFVAEMGEGPSERERRDVLRDKGLQNIVRRGVLNLSPTSWSQWPLYYFFLMGHFQAVLTLHN